MKIIKEENVKQDVIKDILCDVCGKSCSTEYGMEYLSMKANWGFCSNKDLETWIAEICEECVDKHLSFINFTKTNSFTGTKI